VASQWRDIQRSSKVLSLGWKVAWAFYKEYIDDEEQPMEFVQSIKQVPVDNTT
jgi:hypothetical protein